MTAGHRSPRHCPTEPPTPPEQEASHLVRRPRFLTRAVAGAVVLAVAGAATLLTGGVANAQPAVGVLSITPTSGSDLTAASASTSAPCPAASNALHIKLTGPNNMNFLITGRTTAGFSSTSPMVGIPFGQTFKDAAAQNTPSTTLVAGTYTATLNCVSGIIGNTVEASFAGAIVFSSPTAWTVSAPPPVSTPTSTALGVTPASPTTAGTQTTLTATVTPTTATGTVQFVDGTTNIGSPVPASAGTATTSTTLAQGAHSLTAVFTGGTGFANSVSAAVTYQVDAAAPGVTATSTVLTTAPTSTVTQGSPVTLNAAVTPAAAGTVQFRDGTALIGGPVTASGGTATVTTSTLGVGPHTLTAAFTSTDPAFGSSMSATVSVTVTAVAGATATSTVLTTSPPSPVAPGTPVTLNAAIAPAGAAGTVQFLDGGSPIGAPAAVTAGQASTTSTLAAGPHVLTAVFSPTDPGAFGSSTSPAVNFAVNAANGAGTPTSTKLKVFPRHAIAGFPVFLLARVSSRNATGHVQFRDGATDIGAPIPVIGGFAIGMSPPLVAGRHVLTAVFIPADPAAFGPSTSDAVALKVRALFGFGKRSDDD